MLINFIANGYYAGPADTPDAIWLDTPNGVVLVYGLTQAEIRSIRGCNHRLSKYDELLDRIETLTNEANNV